MKMVIEVDLDGNFSDVERFRRFFTDLMSGFATTLPEGPVGKHDFMTMYENSEHGEYGEVVLAEAHGGEVGGPVTARIVVVPGTLIQTDLTKASRELNAQGVTAVEIVEGHY